MPFAVGAGPSSADSDNSAVVVVVDLRPFAASVYSAGAASGYLSTAPFVLG